MKKAIAVCLFFFVALTSFSQTEKNLARVRKVNGVEAYILCEPLRPYQVVVDAGSGIKAESLLTGGIINKSISGKVEQFVRSIMKQNAKVDAVIYTTGRRMVGVVFTGNADSKTAGLATVAHVNGFPVFVMNEPVTDYQVVSSKNGGIKWKSLVTAGVMNNSIEEDVQAMVKKMQSRAADAMLFEGGKDAMAVMFKSK